MDDITTGTGPNDVVRIVNSTHMSRSAFFPRRVVQAHNPYRKQEKEEMIRLGFKTKKAYLKAMKKERMSK